MDIRNMSLKLRLILLGLGIAIIAAVILFLVFSDSPRQFADENFDTKVSRPAFAGEHPKVLFDEAHRNIHTVSGLYKPFVNLITNDGYQIVRNKEPFSRKTLEGYSILVIANALGANEANDSPAFSEEESDAVRDWVQAGGSLLLITDHAPLRAVLAFLHRHGYRLEKDGEIFSLAGISQQFGYAISSLRE